MTVRDLTRQDMDGVISNLNNNFNTNVSVLNEGQLGFALDKPRMSLHGRVLYPEMHQKAAVLMETLCKSHTLTDGNKRASVMAAEYLANINGATLVVPLKAARMAVDCAMDADDRMSEEIAAWFKTHIARDELVLAVMLGELVEGPVMAASPLYRCCAPATGPRPLCTASLQAARRSLEDALRPRHGRYTARRRVGRQITLACRHMRRTPVLMEFARYIPSQGLLIDQVHGRHGKRRSVGRHVHRRRDQEMGTARSARPRQDDAEAKKDDRRKDAEAERGRLQPASGAMTARRRAGKEKRAVCPLRYRPGMTHGSKLTAGRLGIVTMRVTEEVAESDRLRLGPPAQQRPPTSTASRLVQTRIRFRHALRWQATGLMPS